MEDRVRALLPDAREVRRRGDHGLHLLLVEEHDAVVAVRDGVGVPLAEPLDLVLLDRGRELARALELEVHSVLRLGGLDRVEVLHAEPIERAHLVGPARHAVLVPVREARLAEAAVAARGRPADRLRLDEDDPGGGVALLREQRRPEAGVAAADDDEVGDLRCRSPWLGAAAATRAGHRARTPTDGCRRARAARRKREVGVVRRRWCPRGITPMRSRCSHPPARHAAGAMARCPDIRPPSDRANGCPGRNRPSGSSGSRVARRVRLEELVHLGLVDPGEGARRQGGEQARGRAGGRPRGIRPSLRESGGRLAARGVGAA